MNNASYPATDFNESFVDQTTLNAGNQIDGVMPQKFQLTGRISKGPLRAVDIDPNSSLSESPRWNTDYEFVKSFKKRLQPGEVWEWREKYWTGSGFNLDAMSYLTEESAGSGFGYALVIEAKGVKVQGCATGTTKDDNFIGTGPVIFQTEFGRGFEAINDAYNTSSYTSTAASGGIISTRLLIRQFTDRKTLAEADKIYNVDFEKITDNPASEASDGLFIPILADTQISYAQRAREGGTGG